MQNPNIAVILFPGINCEEETLRSVQSVGMQGKIVRWNSDEDLESYDGFILPGGWSYEDRIRAGVISAKDPIMKVIKKQATEGKLVLGICNGCQVLIETGMVPGLEDKIQMALAPNLNPFVSGYYCTWVNTKTTGSSAFTSLIKKNTVIPIPIAHGEGRFVTKDKKLLNRLIKNNQIIFRYCDEKGKVIDKFPINPNGSIYSIAGISNKQGNVLAMMPHPERANWVRQLPNKKNLSFNETEKQAPARKIFESMKNYIEKHF